MRTINFKIEYFTAWGEDVVVDVSDNDKPSRKCLMRSVGDGLWHASVEFPQEASFVVWRYSIMRGEEVLRTEEGGWRRMPLSGDCLEMDVFDTWCSEYAVASPFMHSAFFENIFALDKHQSVSETCRKGKVLFLVGAIPQPDSKRLCIAGNTEGLGKWDPSRAIGLQRIDTYLWGAILPIEECLMGVEYKFVVRDEQGNDAPVWEEGENRRWHPSSMSRAWLAQSVVWGGVLRLASSKPRWAGAAIPLFSLRSWHSWGVGDFRDLRDMATWASGVGMRFLQILPINDTTRDGSWRDSYPYSSRSVFAIHPIYLDPTPWREESFYEEFAKRGAELEKLPALDYEAAMRLKTDFLDRLYSESGRRIRARKAFKDFEKENEYWLPAYTKYKAETRLFGKRRSERYYSFVQYLLHSQLSELRAHFRELRIVLKGDIPIGVSADSVPARTMPELFHLDASAGAPPDDFAREGQNWGFPTYNWEQMSRDGYAWWKERLRHMGRYFDALRIDHVLGFFRIWEIPRENYSGLMGHFRPAMPLSADEMQKSGFTLPPSFFAKPHLTESMILQFGIRADILYSPKASPFQIEGGYYTLKPEYQTESRILGSDLDEETKHSLLKIMREVLFIEDSQQRGKFHPRFRAYETLTYGNLPQEQREGYDVLYEDFFYHRHNDFWREEALKKIKSLFPVSDDSFVSPLPCAEDLGMVPACVPDVLRKCGILSLELRRMPKALGVPLSDLSDNPYLSVDTISTHDMPPLRLWWRNAAGLRNIVWNELNGVGEVPEELTPEVSASIVEQHLSSPSMLCILALQDWLATDAELANPNPKEEQINQPSNPEHYWRWRMHLNIEDLMTATPFNEKLHNMILQSGRV